MKKIISNPIFPIIIFPLILFSPIFLTGKAMFWGTTSTQFVPWWDYAWETILNGYVPLWNPYVGMGAPLIANYQSAIFYPPYWIYLFIYAFAGVQWMAWSITLVVAGHIIWSGLGIARLLEELGTAKLGQTIGGLAYALSGYLVARAGFLSINAAAAWLPWILLYGLLLTRKQNKYFWKLCLVLVMQLLAGHAQTTWYSALLGGLWILFWTFQNQDQKSKLKNFLDPVLKYLGAGLLAVGISAIQLFPTFEYLLQSQRLGEYGYAEAMTYSFWPWRFLTLFTPNLFGNPATGNYWGYGNFWEDAIYIGLFPIILALGLIIRAFIGVFKPDKYTGTKTEHRTVIFLVSIIGVSFLFALGKNTAVFPFLYKNIPTFDLFQAPTRFSIWAVIALAILAGMGADQINKPDGKKKYWMRLSAAGCAAVVGGAILANYLLIDVQNTFFVPIGLSGIWGLGAVILVLFKPNQDQETQFSVWNIMVIGLVGLDLLVAGWGLNPGVSMNFYQVNRNSTVDGRVFMSDDVEYELKFNKFFEFDNFDPGVDWNEMYDAFLPNLPVLNRIEMINNFDPIVPGRYQTWMEEINLKEDKTVLGLMDTALIVGFEESGDLNISNNVIEDFDRVFVANVFRIGGDESEALNMIMSGEFTYKNTIILESISPNELIGYVEGGQGEIRVLEERGGYLKLETNLDKNGWIFWSQSWAPGWVVKIDGGKSTLNSTRANYLFQSANIPGGKHIVEFVYRPGSFIIGAGISLLSVGSFSVFRISQKKRQKSTTMI